MKTKVNRRRESSIHFEATLQAAGRRTVLRLPEKASRKLPSRGQVAVRGKINERTFETVVEPDGEFGHWIGIDARLQKTARIEPGSTVSVEIEPAQQWPEPSVPQDLRDALSKASPNVQALWRAITPMARWEWVRWVNGTRNPETRQRRVEVSISKLERGKRRPCCFNLASCTDPELSKSGKLILS